MGGSMVRVSIRVLLLRVALDALARGILPRSSAHLSSQHNQHSQPPATLPPRPISAYS